jgi:hypothetical protein
MGKVIHRAKEYEQTAGDDPAKMHDLGHSQVTTQSAIVLPVCFLENIAKLLSYASP